MIQRPAFVEPLRDIALMFVFLALSFVCLFVSQPSWKALLKRQVTEALLSDRRSHTLYIVFGIQGTVMLAQIILGFVAGMPIKGILLCIFIYDQAFPFFYAVPLLCCINIRQTLNAKKQMSEDGSEPLPAMTHEEASKTPRMRSWYGMCIILTVLGVIIGVIAQYLTDDHVRVNFVLIALAILFLLTAVAVLVQWHIFHRKK